MEEINKNETSEVARKIGKFIIINFLIELIFAIFINDYLVNLLHSYNLLSRSDLIEIDMLVRSSTHGLYSIINGVFIFKPNIKDIFSSKNQVYKLSLKFKIKQTIFFISIALLFTIPSSFIMTTYTSYIMDIPMPETTAALSFFAIFIAPVLEEILNRGIILNQLKKFGGLFSIIISSVYFGLIHGIGFLHAFINGLFLGTAFILTGNIRWSIMLHSIYNLTLPLIEKLFLPLFPNMSYNLGKLIIAILLFLIFLVTSIRDKELKEFYKRININNIKRRIKEDKEGYMAFINEPVIMVLIVGWIIMQMIPLYAL